MHSTHKAPDACDAYHVCYELRKSTSRIAVEYVTMEFMENV